MNVDLKSKKMKQYDADKLKLVAHLSLHTDEQYNSDYILLVSFKTFKLFVIAFIIFCFKFCFFRSAMWVMPTLLADGVLFIFLLVSACIVSVGYAVFCSNYLESHKGKRKE